MNEAPTTFPYESLKVPDEPGVFWCAKHRTVKTRLRCGRCEKPICPKCTVMGPTGARCRDCASNRSSHIYQVSALQLLSTFIAMTVLGGIGSLLASGIWLFLLLFTPVIGTFFGKAVTTITRGKRGPVLAGVATAGVVAGTLLANAPLFLALMAPANTPVDGLLTNIAYIFIYLALVIGSLWYWVK